MKLGSLRISCSILLCVFLPLAFSMQECPTSSLYPFSCSSCLSFSDQNTTWLSASRSCKEDKGELLTLRDSTEWSMLQLYQESLGLNLTTELWIGYRIVGSQLVDEEGVRAADVLQENFKRSGPGDCVVVSGGKLTNVDCTEHHRYICIFKYSAARLIQSNPPPGPVYHSPVQTLSFEASISGSGVTDLEWRHDGVSLDPSSSGLDMRSNQANTWAKLNLTKGTNGGSERYYGFYELLVTNPAGRAVVATWTIEPSVLGEFNIAPQDLAIPEGGIAFFECAVDSAHPPPTYTWYRGDDPVIPDQTRVFVSSMTHTLLLREVVAEDQGSYRCRVENSAGHIESPPASLTVRPPEMFTGSDGFLLHPRNVTLLEGSLYSMDCVSLQKNSAYFYNVFIGEGDSYSSANSFNYPANGGTPTVTIANVTLQHDRNIVYCYVYDVSEHTGHLSQRGYLTIHTLPRVRLLMNKTEGHSPYSIPHSTRLDLECSIGGVPIPSHQWYQNGDVVLLDDGEVSSGGGGGGGGRGGSEEVRSLQVEPESGVYQCHVSNQYGVAIDSTVVCTQSLPGSTVFSVKSDSTTSLYVTWSPPTPPTVHPLLLRYTIHATSTVTGTTISSGTLLPLQNPWVVTGLDPGMEYQVRVDSWSPLGPGALGEEKNVYTYGPAPTESPLKFLSLMVSRTYQNRGLVIQWSSLLSPPNATIFVYYQVQYREVGKTEALSLRQTQASVGEMYVYINNLENAQNYEIRLRIGVRVQRLPARYDHTPWTEWRAVQGVTTPPPTTSSQPSISPSLGTSGGVGSEQRDDMLLVVVLVPVLSLLLLGALLIAMVGGYCWCRAKRRAASYNPSKIERQRIKGKQVPMGKDVFSMPEFTAAVLAAEEEDAAYCTLKTTTTTSSSRPSSRSEDLTVDSTVLQSDIVAE